MSSLKLTMQIENETRGRVVGTVAGPTWAFADGDKLSVKVDGAPKATGTIDANPGSVNISDTAGTFDVVDAQTLTYKAGIQPIAGLPTRTITFSGCTAHAATQAQFLSNLNGQFIGAVATDNGGGDVLAASTAKGTDAVFQWTGGTALAALGTDGSEHDGTGNVANGAAVTLAEIVALLPAALTVALADSYFTAEAPRSIQLIGISAAEIAGLAVLGLDTDLHITVDNPVLGDIYLDNGTGRLTATLAEEVQQLLYTRFRMYQGEWFANPALGIPYYQKILGIKNSVDVVSTIFRQVITTCPGVSSLTRFLPVISGRDYSLVFDCVLADGTTLRSSDFAPFQIKGV